MTQYNSLNVKLCNSQLNKLKSATKNGTKITLNLSSSLTGSSNDETNFLHKLLVTNTQVSKIRKAFANGSSANVNFSKTLLSKMIQSGGILGELIAGIPQLIYLTGKEVPTKRISLAKDATPTLAKKKQNIILIKE